jgi:hypothetical protein
MAAVLDFLTSVGAHAPMLLELTGVLLIGGGVALTWGSPLALIWLGVACFGMSYALEARRRHRPGGDGA